MCVVSLGPLSFLEIVTQTLASSFFKPYFNKEAVWFYEISEWSNSNSFWLKLSWIHNTFFERSTKESFKRTNRLKGYPIRIAGKFAFFKWLKFINFRNNNIYLFAGGRDFVGSLRNLRA